MQNFGSSFRVFLRGSLEDVNEAFNSFYNLSGLSERSEPEISEIGNESILLFWTNNAWLTRYWQNRFLGMNPNIKAKEVYAGKISDANTYVAHNLKAMRLSPEGFYSSGSYISDAHSFGKVSAESPDLDFKDSVVTHAFKDKTPEVTVEGEGE